MHKFHTFILSPLLALAALPAVAANAPVAKATAAVAAPAPAAAPTLTISMDGATVLSADGKLMWMRCSLGQTLRDGSCQGEPKKYDHRDAANQIKLINLSGGYAGAKDWRLPTIEELQTLIFCDQGFNKNTATVKYASSSSKPLPQACDGERYLRPTIDPIAFPKTSGTWYWSSTPDVDKVLNLWGVSFGTGSFSTISRHNQTMTRAVRVVSSAPAAK